MLKHGSESFFIEGEGLLTTELGGREGDETDPVNVSETPAAAAPKSLAANEAPPFRFSRVGPKGTALDARDHQEAGARDGRGGRGNRRRPRRVTPTSASSSTTT